MKTIKEHNMHDVSAVILGGGRGQRLFPLTLERAKPAVGFGGKFPAAPGAYPGVDFKGPLAVACHAILLRPAGLRNDTVHSFLTGFGLGGDPGFWTFHIHERPHLSAFATLGFWRKLRQYFINHLVYFPFRPVRAGVFGNGPGAGPPPQDIPVLAIQEKLVILGMGGDLEITVAGKVSQDEFKQVYLRWDRQLFAFDQTVFLDY